MIPRLLNVIEKAVEKCMFHEEGRAPFVKRMNVNEMEAELEFIMHSGRTYAVVVMDVTDPPDEGFEKAERLRYDVIKQVNRRMGK